MRPRAAGFRCRILDNGLFISNLSGSSGLVTTHFSPRLRDSETLTQLSYQ